MNFILGSPHEDDELRAGAVREANGVVLIFIESKQRKERIGFRGSIAYHLEDPDRFDHNLRLLCDKAGVPTHSRVRADFRRRVRAAMNMPVDG